MMEQNTMPDRAYDIVLYGATGFVGSRAAEYLATHPQRDRLRWAISGRDRSKLERIKQSLGTAASAVDILVADSQDLAAVDAIVAQTRVLLNTAGPFARYGDPNSDPSHWIGRYPGRTAPHGGIID